MDQYKKSSPIKRWLQIDLGDHPAAFLWGPRQVGKSTLLKQQFPHAKNYDLLESEQKQRLLKEPFRLREEVVAQRPSMVIIDEIQKVPSLLDEVHWCIENTSTQFILCGSSARKLKRGAANLLGGRAWRFELFPLTMAEINGGHSLEKILNHGMIPRHYLMKRPERSLRSYVTDYLQEEIQEEALVRNLPTFARFLDSVAMTNGELINFAHIARECGVSHKTAREYYQILKDTLLGHSLEPWRRRKNRRLIETEKFYLFDTGVVRALLGMVKVQEKTELFGKFFEHFLIEEVRAYLAYTEKYLPLYFWRTSTGFEVDLIVGNMQVAIEFKAARRVHVSDCKGLRALKEEYQVNHSILVCQEKQARFLDIGVLVLPWEEFCHRLWREEFF